MKKSNPLLLTQSYDHLKWTDDKIYIEIKTVLNSKYENARIEKICYENPFTENVHGTFTFLDKFKNTLHTANYKVFMDELKIDWGRIDSKSAKNK